MKSFILVLLILASFKINAKSIETDSTKNSFLKKISLNFTWFEIGPFFPLSEKKINDLPYGINDYLKYSSGSPKISAFGFGVYYKNKIGVELILDMQSYNNGKSNYRNYISEKYSNYYIKNYTDNNVSSIGIGYRVNYRFFVNKFYLTPKFQLGVNNFNIYDQLLILKEKGSNQFIEYSISKKNLKKNIFDYHLLLELSRKITTPPMEIGIKAEFFLIPTKFKYTITEQPYGGDAIINDLTIKQNHPSLSFGFFCRVFIKK